MSANAAVTVLEEIRCYTPLGIRFWDPVQDRQIRDGLRVTAWRAATAGRIVTAYRTRSDIYALQGLPGLRDLEHSDGPSDESVPASPPVQTRYIVQVEDILRRFLPVTRAIGLPLLQRGVFPRRVETSPPGAALPGFLLFSAVSRPRSSWLAGVYGVLFDHTANRAAAHAKVQVRIGGQDVYGLSDAAGRFAVQFPYPGITEDLRGSPPPALGLGSLYNQSWEVELRVFYRPGDQVALPRTAIPDYLSVLTQPQAEVWRESPQSSPSPGPQVHWAGVLEYGQELHVMTTDEQRLLVVPVS